MALDGSDVTRLTDTKADEFSAEVSPDGERIAFVKSLTQVLPPDSEQRRRFLVQIVDIDGGNRVTVQRGRGSDLDPTWAPDSRRIAIASDRADKRATDDSYRYQLFLAAADGTGVERTLKSAFSDALPDFVP